MNVKIYQYDEFNEENIRFLCEKSSTSLLVYDSKPSFSYSFTNSIDLNVFKLLSWKNLIKQYIGNTVIFYIKKFSNDILHSLAQNVYENIYFFTEEEDLNFLFNKILDSKIELIYYDDVVENDFLTTLNDFEIFKIEYCKSFEEKMAIFTKNNLIFKNETFLNCLEIPENKRNEFICFIFDFDKNDYRNLNFKDYKKIIIFILIWEHGINEEICDIFKIQQNGLEYVNLEYFKWFKENYEGSNIIDYLLQDNVNFVDNLQLTEVKIGNAKFPLQFSRFIFETILRDIKNSLETCLLYIRNIAPTISNDFCGFLDKEFKAKIAIPGLFDFEVESDPYLIKKDTINNACYKFIEKLYNENILTDHLEINLKSLLKLNTIKNLYFKTYQTDDFDKIYSKFLEFKERVSLPNNKVGSIIEKDKKVFIATYKGVLSSYTMFKKENMIDLQSDVIVIPKVDDEMDEIYKFESDNLKSYFYAKTPEDKLLRSYRKIPDCLLVRSYTLSLYSCSNMDTGILCMQSFTNIVTFGGNINQNVEIEFLGTRKYSNKELKIIKFYQVIFFKHFTEIFYSNNKTFNLYYYVVPLKSENNKKSIDWDYLSNIFDNFIVRSVQQDPNQDFLIFNPFSKEFCVYYNLFDGNIEDTIEDTTFLNYYESKYDITLINRTGKNLFKSLLCEQISALVRKKMNVAKSAPNLPVDAESQIVKEKLFKTLAQVSITKQYDKLKESKKNLNKNKIDISNILNAKSIENGTFYINSSESCFVTTVKSSILCEVELFKMYFCNFEIAFLAFELIQKFEIKASISTVIKALTQTCENRNFNYERLEFLGDCLLKFYTTNLLYLLHFPMNKIVSVKSSIISNDNLFKMCIDSGIYKYFNISLFNSKMVQAPYLSGMDEITKYFNADKAFDSDNLYHNIEKSFNNDSNVKKMYADVIEALIGAIYYDSGILEAVKFMNKINLFKDISLPDKTPIMNAQKILKEKSAFYNFKYGKLNFNGLLDLTEIMAIQSIIGYSFKSTALIERAFVHPSFSPTLKSDSFEFLELIGDCALDLYISTKLYNISYIESPLYLHCAKLSYVNNLSLNKIIVKTGLIKYTKHNLNDNCRYKKYSDMMEALFGAILVDLEWDFNEFCKVCDSKLLGFLEEHKDLSQRGL